MRPLLSETGTVSEASVQERETCSSAHHCSLVGEQEHWKLGAHAQKPRSRLCLTKWTEHTAAVPGHCQRGHQGGCAVHLEHES